MIETSKSYSRKRLEDAFNIYVMLSDSLEFTVAEVMQAVAEDYPTLPRHAGAFVGDGTINTAGAGLAFLSWTETDPLVMFMTPPQGGEGGIDWPTVVQKSRFQFPDAAQMVERHQTLLCISVHSRGTSYAERFEAARLMTCIGAVFARLQDCLGVYFPSADMIIPPATWVDAADEAVAGRLPVMQWINLQANLVPDGKTPVPVTASTIGLAAFLGCEVAVILARIPPGEAVKIVYAACKLLGEYGHRFRDSDTFGPEDDEVRYRIRFQSEGLHGAQTDVWVLLHPTFPHDDVALFGPRLLPPPPPGVLNRFKGDAGWLRRLLGKTRV